METFTATLRTEEELRDRFEREVTPLMPVLYRHALRTTRQHADAEDLVQDTMVKAYSAFGSFRAGSNLKGWLYRIMTNNYINNYRRKMRQPTFLPVEGITDKHATAAAEHSSTGLRTAEDQALDNLGDARINAAMRELHRSFGLTVYYADVEGYRYKQIAQIMNCSVGVVKSRLHRGRLQLRRRLSLAADCPACRAREEWKR